MAFLLSVPKPGLLAVKEQQNTPVGRWSAEGCMGQAESSQQRELRLEDVTADRQSDTAPKDSADEDIRWVVEAEENSR